MRAREPTPLYAQIPPEVAEAERIVLACLLRMSLFPATAREMLLQALEELDEDAFFLETHQLLFREIRRFHREHGSIDLPVLLESLGRGELAERVSVEYVKDLVTEFLIALPTPVIQNALELVRGTWLKRKIHGVLQRAVEKIYDVETPAREVLTTLVTELHSLHRTLLQNQVDYTVESLMGDLLARLQEQAPRTPEIARTGFARLDEVLQGLRPENLWILAARPGVGKTTLALNLALRVAEQLAHAAEPRWVLFFSLEMGPREIGSRLLAIRARVNSRHILGLRLSPSEKEQVIAAAQQISDLPLYFFFPTNLSPEMMRARIQEIQQDRKPGIVVVDYLQRMQTAKPRESRVQEVTEISNKLKDMAREFQVCVIALSQLSREIERRPEKTPRLSDLRESGAIEQDADVVMFLQPLLEAPAKKTREEEEDVEETRVSLTLLVNVHPEEPDYGDILKELEELETHILESPEYRGKLEDLRMPQETGEGIVVRLLLPQSEVRRFTDFVRKNLLLGRRMVSLYSRDVEQIRVLVSKNRHGPQDLTVPLWFRKDWGLFSEQALELGVPA